MGLFGTRSNASLKEKFVFGDMNFYFGFSTKYSDLTYHDKISRFMETVNSLILFCKHHVTILNLVHWQSFYNAPFIGGALGIGIEALRISIGENQVRHIHNNLQRKIFKKYS